MPIASRGSVGRPLVAELLVAQGTYFHEAAASVAVALDLGPVAMRRHVAAAPVGVAMDLAATGHRRHNAAAGFPVSVDLTPVAARRVIGQCVMTVAFDLTVLGRRRRTAASEISLAMAFEAELAWYFLHRAPSDRLFEVPWEWRAFDVPAEVPQDFTRVFDVSVEVRAFDVPHEDRGFIVPPDSETLVPPQNRSFP